jgi:hypothetical protein
MVWAGQVVSPSGGVGSSWLKFGTLECQLECLKNHMTTSSLGLIRAMLIATSRTKPGPSTRASGSRKVLASLGSMHRRPTKLVAPTIQDA